jgi:uncharacterized protein HemX
VDLQSSACGQPGAVQCSELGAGVDEACCPQYTTCAPGYNATTTSVRCNIRELALQALTPSATSSIGEAIKTMSSTSEVQESTQSSQSSDRPSSSSSSESIKSTSMTASTNPSSSVMQSTQSSVHTPPETSGPATITYLEEGPPVEIGTTQSTSGSDLNTGALAGIVIGAVAVAILLVLALWLMWRKRRRTRSQDVASIQHQVDEKQSSARLQDQYEEPNSYPIWNKHEMEDTRRQELWGGSFSPKEMQTREVAELDGSAR